MSKFSQYRTFITVVETGSLTSAANTLNKSVSSVSKQLSALEASLETKLLDRSTKSLAITALGKEFYLQCRQIIESTDSAEQSLKNARDSINGKIRLSFPEVLLNSGLIAVISEFATKFPEIQFDLKTSNSLDDAISDQIDFCFRIGDLADSRLTAIKLGAANFLCCASPHYVGLHGYPTSLLDALSTHRFLVPSYVNVAERLNRIFSIKSPLSDSRMHIMNSEIAIHKAMLNGMGIGVLLDISIKDRLSQGELINLFPTLSFPEQAIYLVFNTRDFMPKKMSSFKDHILQNFPPTLLP